MTDEKKEEYNSTHDGPTIDAAVTRASEGGSIDAAIQAKPNPNLLDNWYFGNPVNQRGQTSWVNPSDWQYSIDRWQITPSSVIALVDGGITITADFHQGLEKDRLEFGRTYTFSVLSSDGRLGKHTFVLTSDTDINIGFGFGYFVCYLSGGNVWFRLYGDGSTYKASTLEVGSQQTLAHQDAHGNWILNEIPDYGEQLRRCQRYDYIIGRTDDAAPVGLGTAYSETSVIAVVELPETMRTNPAVSITGLAHLRFSASQNIVSSSVKNYGFPGDRVQLFFDGLSGLTQGQSCDIYVPQGSKIEFNSNL